jgi:methionyl-tRNA formyltransferase
VSASPLRIVFAGTPEFAHFILGALLDAPDCEVLAAYTQPDRPAGRGRRLQPSPVKECARTRGIPCSSRCR